MPRNGKRQSENVVFSHFPIIDSNQEDVVGILDTKDYFRSEDKSKEYVMKHAVDTPYFVPENMKANVLFCQHEADKNLFLQLFLTSMVE